MEEVAAAAVEAAEALAAAATEETEEAAAAVKATKELAAMVRQEAVGGCKEMMQHIRQIDTAATATAGKQR